MYSSNEIIFWSQIFKIKWIKIKYLVINADVQDEEIVKKLGNCWWLHHIFKEAASAEVLMGVRENEVNRINRLEASIKGELSILSNHEVVDLLQSRHANCYTTGDWDKLEWKWTRRSQQVLADFLDLLCAGWIYWLPNHWNKWKDEAMWAQRNLDTYDCEVITEAKKLQEKLKASGLDYEKEAHINNLGCYFDLLEK